MTRLSELTLNEIEVLIDAISVAKPHGNQVVGASAVYVVGRYIHAPLHRQRLVVAFEWKVFVVESGGGAVDVMGAGGQEHRQPLRRDRVGVVDLHQLARHTSLRHVRVEGGAEGCSDADEDERAEARGVLLHLWVEIRKFRGGGALNKL